MVGSHGRRWGAVREKNPHSILRKLPEDMERGKRRLIRRRFGGGWLIAG
jgi:uncharacterized protein VirK/YbjX